MLTINTNRAALGVIVAAVALGVINIWFLQGLAVVLILGLIFSSSIAVYMHNKTTNGVSDYPTYTLWWGLVYLLVSLALIAVRDQYYYTHPTLVEDLIVAKEHNTTEYTNLLQTYQTLNHSIPLDYNTTRKKTRGFSMGGITELDLEGLTDEEIEELLDRGGRFVEAAAPALPEEDEEEEE